MKPTHLPSGIDPSAARKCIEHPLGKINDDRSTPVRRDLVERTCWYGKPSGCTNGYCWKSCGNGPWCWTARSGGFGDWYTCSKDSDCKTAYACGQVAGDGKCDSCGCSC
ncbi:uncharacterized protein GGS25DRAFT_79978 [Hypoxylon fragiforme]|uniref:uncharacterized protein n=1 Tax=Hypoxylon fragiforme TaxID=63214 RepID=UPI0020C5D964|nr:uncharacterized protein GGS25DRAFT_79978 [Hypoxylon fragiforme]KAI2603099.1 hypothetical protein GGS25DRAFT_79978 [Hypoxylon fragiforme]